MFTIPINSKLYEALGDENANEVAKILKQNRILGEEEIEIVGRDDIRMPDVNSQVFGMTFGDSSDVGDGAKIQALGIGSIGCKIACNAAAAAAAAALTLTGPALAAALAAIAVAREECLKRC